MDKRRRSGLEPLLTLNGWAAAAADLLRMEKLKVLQLRSDEATEAESRLAAWDERLRSLLQEVRGLDAGAYASVREWSEVASSVVKDRAAQRERAERDMQGVITTLHRLRKERRVLDERVRRRMSEQRRQAEWRSDQESDDWWTRQRGGL